MNKTNIVLIGMPGAGKSTVGVILAKTAGLEFIDTDLVIQSKTGQKLQDLINSNGIDYFLKTEGKIVSELTAEKNVIATGGSVVYSPDAMNNLKKNGIIVYLDVPLSEIKKRINNITTRGIAMTPGETLDNIFSEREPLYKKYADITVPLSSTEKTVEKILSQIGKHI